MVREVEMTGVLAVIQEIGTRKEQTLYFPSGTEPREVLRHVRQNYPRWVFTEFLERKAA